MKRKKRYKVIFSASGIFLLLICLFTISVHFAYSQDKQKKAVLVLHSYHRGLAWTDNITDGIESILQNKDQDIELSFEYMDTKRIFDDQHLHNLHELYSHKFGHSKFDVIISSDDHAFHFLLSHHGDISPDTPVVFCGVNYFEDSMLVGHELFTGVVESINIKETIDIALQLHPDTREIYVIVDRTLSGTANKKLLMEVIPYFEKAVTFTFLEDLDMPEVQERVQELPDNSIVLLVHFTSDRSGNVFSYKKSTAMIAEYCRVPMYNFWDIHLGNGIVGGMLTSGYAQGVKAAETALRILQGEKAENIPVVKESPNRYMFDYNQMQHFGIKLSQLPEDSIVINMPSSFYSEYKGLIRLVAASISILTLIILVLLINILKRKKAEKALRESEEWFRTIVETAPSFLLIDDAGGKTIYVSPNCEEMTGYTREEFLGKNIWWVHEDNIAEAKELFDSTFYQEKGYKNFIHKAVKKSGEIRYFSSSWEPLRDREGKFNGGLLLTIDITDQKKTEDALLESEGKLMQAQKMEAIGRLAGGIAHDFNNLLTTILGYSDLLIMKPGLDRTHRTYIEEIKKSSERAASLTQQLLAFSRKQMLQPKIINLNKVINETEKMLRRLIGENIELLSELDPDLGQIKADPGQIEQVIMNLVINAGDAMPKGGKLTIETGNVYLDENYIKEHGEVKTGDYVLLSVIDTGHGMDEETTAHIFEPFFTTKEIGRGTGLGLSTVFGIVKQSGGHVWVYSELDHGTTFKIYLPRIEEVDEKKKEVLEQIKSTDGSETILLVEDEDSVRNMTYKILDDFGYTVIEASNGRKALKIIDEYKGGRIDLLITDVIMPEMSGRELADHLLTRYPHLKVLYISGYTDNAIVHHGVLDEGVSFLQKPFSPLSLARKIREVLEKP